MQEQNLNSQQFRYYELKTEVKQTNFRYRFEAYFLLKIQEQSYESTEHTSDPMATKARNFASASTLSSSAIFR